MDTISSIIYGVIQGLTEFLPVSSSGHLALLPKVLKVADPGVVFDLAMHLGTSLAVIMYFRKDIWILLIEFINLFKLGKKGEKKSPFVINLILSSLVTFVMVMLLKKLSFTFGRAAMLISINLIVFGIVMWLADKFSNESSENILSEKIRFKTSFLIGFMQSLAIFPGVSRSGITITACRFMGLSKSEGSKYSFILSLPIILGGFVYKLPEFLESYESFGIVSCLVGTGISFLVGIFAIHLFISTINRIGFLVFTIYRILLAVVIMFWILN